MNYGILNVSRICFLFLCLINRSVVFAVDCTQYTNTFTTSTGDAKIQYVSTGTTLSVLFTTTRQGWVAMGRSQNGAMVGPTIPSDAVIGIPGSGVKRYVLSAYAVPVANAKQTLLNTQITQTASGTTMKFTQNLNDSPLPISSSGGNVQFIWAIGSSNTLGYHAVRGSFTLNLTPCTNTTVVSTSAPTKSTVVRKPTRKPTSKPVPGPCSQYTKSISVDGGSTTIQYVSTKSYISFLLTTKRRGWVAIGRSREDDMVPADAVIGMYDTNSVRRYVIQGYSASKIIPNVNQTLFNTQITQSSSGTVMKFTQYLNDKPYVLNPYGYAQFIWAIGRDNTFAFHATMGSFRVQLSPCDQSTPAKTPTIKPVNKPNRPTRKPSRLKWKRPTAEPTSSNEGDDSDVDDDNNDDDDSDDDNDDDDD